MSTEYTRLLMYFILVLGVILIGVQLLFFVEIQKAKTDLQYATIKLNQTQASVNQTQLFLATKFYVQSMKNQEEMLQRIEIAITQNGNISKDVLNISQEHQKVGLDHNRIQQNISNDLFEYGENSIVKFEMLEKKLDKILNQTSSK